MQEYRSNRKSSWISVPAALWAIALAMLALPVSPLFSQSTTKAAPESVSVAQAVRDALSHSNSVESAVADWNSAREKALKARLEMLPSLSLSGAYTRLSSLPSSDTSITFPSPPFPPNTTISLATPQDAFNFGVSLRYPIFSGFRLLEAAKIATLQSTGKEVGVQIVRNALTFEVQRAYWESVRASANVTTMQKNLQLVHVLLGQVKDEVDQGLATQSDLLSAEEHYSQAQIMLNDSVSGRDQAFLALSSLLGQDKLGARLAESGAGGFLANAEAAYTFSTDPAISQYPQFDGKLDVARLVTKALADRPEMRTASVGVEAAQHAAKVARGGLYPTLALIGDYTYANPNQRVPFATKSQFTGTWDVGVAVNIDVGKVPAGVAGMTAAGQEVGKAQAQAQAERTKVVLDVRKSVLGYEQARQDLTMTKSMVTQADENLRVTRQKFDNGVAKRSDVLQAELALLRAQFAVTNKEVDVQIAAADLARAIAAPFAK